MRPKKRIIRNPVPAQEPQAVKPRTPKGRYTSAKSATTRNVSGDDSYLEVQVGDLTFVMDEDEVATGMLPGDLRRRYDAPGSRRRKMP